MATRKTVVKAPKIARTLKSPVVTLSSNLRKAYKWVDVVAAPSLDAGIKRRRSEARKGGPKLSSVRLTQVLRQLERIQQQINPLEVRKGRLVNRLKAHWGHTGDTELKDDELGNALISTSATLAVDPVVVRNHVGEEVWKQIVEETLSPELLLALADRDPGIQRLLWGMVIIVSKFEVSVTPPSSRRPRSGKLND